MKSTADIAEVGSHRAMINRVDCSRRGRDATPAKIMTSRTASDWRRFSKCHAVSVRRHWTAIVVLLCTIGFGLTNAKAMPHNVTSSRAPGAGGGAKRYSDSSYDDAVVGIAKLYVVDVFSVDFKTFTQSMLLIGDTTA